METSDSGSQGQSKGCVKIRNDTSNGVLPRDDDAKCSQGNDIVSPCQKRSMPGSKFSECKEEIARIKRKSYGAVVFGPRLGRCVEQCFGRVSSGLAGELRSTQPSLTL